MTRTGYRLIATAIVLSLTHHADHVLRGGDATGWPLTSSVNAFTYSLAIYPIVAAMAILSWQGRAGPRSWRCSCSQCISARTPERDHRHP